MKGSLRKVAKKVNCSNKTIRAILKKMKKPILCYKRTKRPNKTPLKRLVARLKCKRLFETYRNSDFILDDESYFTLNNSTLSGNDTYYSNNRTLTPDDVKHYDKSKYEPKVLVLLSISTKDINQVHIRPCGMAINQGVYLNES